jgi:hypothetical protein
LSLIVLHVSQAVSGVVAGIIQEFVLVSQISNQEHSHKQLQSSKQTFQFILNFQFIFKSPELTSTLFNILDKSFQLLLDNFSPEFKTMSIAEDRQAKLRKIDKAIIIFFIVYIKTL